FARSQRTIQGKRVAGAAAIAIGRDHIDVGKRLQRPGEARQPGCKISVVVAEEDAHRRLGARARYAGRKIPETNARTKCGGEPALSANARTRRCRPALLEVEAEFSRMD